jgi:hypothetical protein
VADATATPAAIIDTAKGTIGAHLITAEAAGHIFPLS